MSFSIIVVGCSRGIGLEFVKQLSKETKLFGKIYAASRNKTDELDQVIKQNSNVKYIKLDFLDESSIKSAADEVGKDLGASGLNFLINNGAVLPFDSIEEITAEKMNFCFGTNVTGPTIVIKEFLPLLKKAGNKKEKAVIINISSAVGSFGITDASFAFSYRMSKAALNMLTHTIHFHLKDSGVDILSVHPGAVQTDMTQGRGQKTAQQSVTEIMENVVKKPEGFFDKMVNYAGEILPW